MPRVRRSRDAISANDHHNEIDNQNQSAIGRVIRRVRLRSFRGASESDLQPQSRQPLSSGPLVCRWQVVIRHRNNQSEALRILDHGSQRHGLRDFYAEKRFQSLSGARRKVVGEYRILLGLLRDALLDRATAFALHLKPAGYCLAGPPGDRRSRLTSPSVKPVEFRMWSDNLRARGVFYGESISPGAVDKRWIHHKTLLRRQRTPAK